MRDSTLWRKQSTIVIMISEALNVDIEQALDIFYHSKAYQQLQDAKYGLHLMSDKYIVEDVLDELKNIEDLRG